MKKHEMIATNKKREDTGYLYWGRLGHLLGMCTQENL
jgi:hypothetical protein